MFDIEKDVNISSVISLGDGTIFVCTNITYDNFYQYFGFTTTNENIKHEYTHELTINDETFILDIYNKHVIFQGSKKFENAKIIGHITMGVIHCINHKNIQAIFGEDNKKIKYSASKGEIYDFTENKDKIKICIIAKDTNNTNVDVPVYFYDYYKNHIRKGYIDKSIFNDDNIEDKFIYKPKTCDVEIEYVNNISRLNSIRTVTYKLLDNNEYIPSYIVDILRNTAKKYIE